MDGEEKERRRKRTSTATSERKDIDCYVGEKGHRLLRLYIELFTPEASGKEIVTPRKEFILTRDVALRNINCHRQIAFRDRWMPVMITVMCMCACMHIKTWNL